MMLGRRVQQYQFTEKLGAGGMGEIYKATDTRLGRTVAIKVLPSARSGDPDRRRRFLQEAQAASGLNHPSIITIHDVISEGDTEFMVMEYVQGKTLNDLIPKGGLRVPLVIKYALQMADALSTAHAAGIVHRDLKPANVMVTESGLVKILDFGLAKLTDAGPIPDDENTRTIANSAPLTVEGSILGTVSYMSPEQAQGKKVDTRSDIFSFGAVLYEIATGRRAFEGESSLSTLSSILRDEPKPMIEVAPDVPPSLESVFLRCLRKNPDDRWQSMKDVQSALSALKRESDSGSLYTSRMMTPAAPPAASAVVEPSRAPLPPASNISAPPGKAMLSVGILAVLLIAGGSTLYVVRKQAAQRAADAAAATTSAAQQAQQAPAPAPVEAPPPPAPADTGLTNGGIEEMVKARVNTDTILNQIRTAEKTNFDLSTPAIISLSKAGASPLIIEQMRNPKRTPLPPPSAAPSTPQSAKKNAAPAPAPAPIPVAVATPAPAPAPVPIAAAPAAILTPTPVPVAAPKMTSVAVPDALPLRITLAAEIPADADLARPIRFTATEDFAVGGTVVIAKGASVYGEISQAGGKKGVFGIGGTKLSFKLTKAEAVGGKTLNVRALAARRADGVTQRQVDTGQKAPKDTAALQGTLYIAYIDGEQNLTVPQK